MIKVAEQKNPKIIYIYVIMYLNYRMQFSICCQRHFPKKIQLCFCFNERRNIFHSYCMPKFLLKRRKKRIIMENYPTGIWLFEWNRASNIHFVKMKIFWLWGKQKKQEIYQTTVFVYSLSVEHINQSQIDTTKRLKGCSIAHGNIWCSAVLFSFSANEYPSHEQFFFSHKSMEIKKKLWNKTQVVWI